MRSLIRKPWFSAVSVLTIALGIAACTVVFSLISAVLLRPLPHGNAGRIVSLLHNETSPVSPADFEDWKKDARTFDALEAAVVWSAVLTGTEAAEQVVGLQMTNGMFDVLGDQAALGRTFAPGETNVVVLGDSLWKRRFGGNPAVVGTTVRLSDKLYTIVGVMPPAFQFPPFWATAAEMWVPLDPKTLPASRQARMLRVFGKLRAGGSLDAARSEMNGIAARLASAYPDSNAGVRTVSVQMLEEKAAGSTKTPLMVLFGGVGLLLLIGCTNVASVMLARALERRREIGVRMAMGASAARIARQLLGETLQVSLAGGILGALIAAAVIGAMPRWLDGGTAGSIRMQEVRLDWMAVAFATAVSVVTGLLFGLAPAWQASRADVMSGLRDGSRGTSEGSAGMRLRSLLVVAETALCLVLLAGAGVLLRSYVRMKAIDPGFESRNLLTMTVSLAGRPEYVGARRDALYDEIQQQVRAIPGVMAAGMVNHLPVGGDTWGTRVAAEGAVPAAFGQEIGAVIRVSAPGYFGTMRIPLASGRDFSSSDRPDSTKVVVINERLANLLWPGQDPLGKRLTTEDPRRSPEWLTVAGVIRNVRQNDFLQEASPELYVPYAQSEASRATTSPARAYMTLVARTTGDASVAASIRSTIARIDKDIAVTQVRSADRIIDNLLWQARMTTAVTGVFAVAALLLACVGIYGVMSYVAASRSREIGIRVALGAQRISVIALFAKQGLALTGTGAVLGVAASLVLLRFLSSLVYSVNPIDPITLSGAPLVLMVAGMLALLVPAVRASRSDPASALRA